MAGIGRIKRRSSGAAGAPASLMDAELAYNEVDDTVYIGKGTGGTGGSATTVEIVGGKGAVVMLTTDQTVGGKKTFSTPPAVPTPVANTDATNKAYVDSKVSNAGGGDMLKSTYDTNGDGVVDAAASVPWGGVTGKPTNATSAADGFMSAGDKTKLDGVAANANNYVHPSGDGNQHVPATGTTSNGKVLKASSTAGSAAWTALAETDITGLVADLAAKASTSYVDNAVANAVAGLDPKASVRLATAAALPTNTRAANVLTASANGVLTIDGTNVAAGDRVLVKNEATAANNGIYTVTNAGATGAAWVLTRATDFDSWSEIPGSYAFVEVGSANADSAWVSTADQGGTLNTSAIPFSQFSGPGLYQAASAVLTTLAGASANGQSLVVAPDYATMRGLLGLGDMALQSSGAVAITGGTIDNIVFDGGTF